MGIMVGREARLRLPAPHPISNTYSLVTSGTSSNQESSRRAVRSSLGLSPTSTAVVLGFPDYIAVTDENTRPLFGIHFYRT